MTRKQLHRLIENYLDGTATDEERQRVDAWYAGFNDSEVRISASSPEEKERLEARLWASIIARTQDEAHLPAETTRLEGFTVVRGHERRVSWRPYLRWAAAVILAVGIALTLWLYRTETVPGAVAQLEAATVRGQRTRVTLPDGSVVWLNAESRLSYPEQFAGGSREVFLTGEAFFDVAPDPGRPFRVRTPRLTTQVLGTSFNVRAYGELAPEVSVSTGRVLVKAPQQGGGAGKQAAELLLTPNERATLDSAKQTLTKTIVKSGLDYAAWRDGTLVFDQTPMREVAQTLGRKYNVTVRIASPSVYNCQLFGKYREQPLENLLGIICSLTRTNYHINGRDVSIQGQGCSPN